MTEVPMDRHVKGAIDGEATPKLDAMFDCVLAEAVTLPLVGRRWTSHS